jgi:hypothetical protein
MWRRPRSSRNSSDRYYFLFQRKPSIGWTFPISGIAQVSKSVTARGRYDYRVKTRITFLIGLALWGGCSKKPAQPLLHVVAYDSCERPQLVGTVGNMEFSLNLQVDKQTAMTVACPNPGLGLQDVGKDFPARVDLDHGLISITIPVYAIPTREEWSKGLNRGKQSGTAQVPFVIDHMREVQTK